MIMKKFLLVAAICMIACPALSNDEAKINQGIQATCNSVYNGTPARFSTEAKELALFMNEFCLKEMIPGADNGTQACFAFAETLVESVAAYCKKSPTISSQNINTCINRAGVAMATAINLSSPTSSSKNEKAPPIKEDKAFQSKEVMI